MYKERPATSAVRVTGLYDHRLRATDRQHGVAHVGERRFRDAPSGQKSLALRVANRWLAARREPVRDGEHDVAAGLVRLETAVAVPERALLGRERHDPAGPGIDGPDAADRVGVFVTVRA